MRAKWVFFVSNSKEKSSAQLEQSGKVEMFSSPPPSFCKKKKEEEEEVRVSLMELYFGLKTKGWPLDRWMDGWMLMEKEEEEVFLPSFFLAAIWMQSSLFLHFFQFAILFFRGWKWNFPILGREVGGRRRGRESSSHLEVSHFFSGGREGGLQRPPKRQLPYRHISRTQQ